MEMTGFFKLAYAIPRAAIFTDRNSREVCGVQKTAVTPKQDVDLIKQRYADAKERAKHEE
jgi:hypothetical protein